MTQTDRPSTKSDAVRPCRFRVRARAEAVIVLTTLLALACASHDGSAEASSSSSTSAVTASNDSSGGSGGSGSAADANTTGNAAGGSGGAADTNTTGNAAGGSGGAADTDTTGNAAGGTGGTTVINAEACGHVAAADAKVDHSAQGHIVVLGSSTAEGKNAKDPENAWVARYTKHVTAEFPNFVVDNLAVGGFNTYRIQATDYVPPEGRPTPRPESNITAALALAPDAIIVNLPNNDQAEGFTLVEQMDNYERVAQLASDAGVLLWIATPQPRNFSEAAQLQDLMDARDAITDRFSPHAIDFWTNIANPDGTIQAAYHSGDNVHLNDAGHGVLAEMVISCAIPQVILTSEH